MIRAMLIALALGVLCGTWLGRPLDIPTREWKAK